MARALLPPCSVRAQIVTGGFQHGVLASLLLLAACVDPVASRDHLLGSAAPSGGTSTAASATDGGAAQSADGGGATGSGIDGDGDLDAMTLALVANGAYQGSARFRHVSRGPYASTAVAGSLIDVWVSTEAFDEYATIAPGAVGSGASLPLGAVIVRAVSDASGAVQKLTVMRRGPAGVDPSLDDWWFAETDATGVPIIADGGALVGPMPACATCHLGRADDDYLFGVPLDAR